MMIELQRFNTVHEAELAASALETRDIDCEVRDGFVVGVDAELSVALGGVALCVSDEQIEDARCILDGDTAEAAFASDGEGATCAGCGEPLPNALAACADCNAQPEREVMTPRRTRWAIVKLKITLIATFVALAIAPTILEPMWRRFTDLSEQTVVTISWTIAALIVGAIVVKSMNASDSRL